MLRPGVSMHSIHSMSSSLRNISAETDDKSLLRMSSMCLSANLNVDKIDKNRLPIYNNNNNNNNSEHKSPCMKITPEIIITDENCVVHNELTYNEPNNEQNNKLLPVTPKKKSDDSSLTHVYFRRWIILFIFSFISLLSAFNWIEYNIIQDVTIHFYNKSLPEGEAEQNDAVNWFSMIYMLCYIPLVFPAMFLLDKRGLKLSIVLGGLLTTIGSVIKCFAVEPEYFLVAFLGQTICAIAQAFTLSVPARLSALWFGPTQIALATSIGVFGNQLGAAVGFLLPPIIVFKSDNVEDMKRQFLILLIPLASLCGLVTLAAIIFIKDQPEKPPSVAQLEIRNQLIRYESLKSQEKQSDFQLFRQSLMNLFKNSNFDLLLISYGINTGSYYAIGTLLNQIVSFYHQNENEKIGLIGLTLVLSGLIGAVIGGIILDRTKAYKATTFAIYACAFISMVLFTLTLSINIWIIFATAFLLGFFLTGYLPVGFELAAEITYPEPEGSSCGLLNSSAQFFGIGYTYIQGRLISMYGATAGNIFISVSLLIGTIITGFIKSDLRRQKAIAEFNKPMKNENKSDCNNNTIDC